MTSNWLSLVIAISSALSSIIFAYLAYSFSRQTRRASTQQEISNIHNDILKFRAEHPEMLRLCALWKHDCFEAVYRQAGAEDKNWATYYTYCELILRFVNTVLYGIKNRSLDKSIYRGQFMPLIRMLLTENYPFVASIVPYPHVSSLVKSFVQEQQEQGWNWQEKHRTLLCQPDKNTKPG